MTRYGPRPELGKLTKGQRVMVRRSSNETRRVAALEQYWIPAVVVKAGRVWVDLETAEGHRPRRTWRMRKDRQDEGTQYSGSNASFATLEQHEWDETNSWALAALQSHGIDLRYDSPWRGREIELAGILAGKKPGNTEEKGQ